MYRTDKIGFFRLSRFLPFDVGGVHVCTGSRQERADRQNRHIKQQRESVTIALW